MPKISFCFQGWISGAEVNTVIVTETGKELDVRDVDIETLTENLQDGIWMISLGDYLYDNHNDSEIEIFNFED